MVQLNFYLSDELAQLVQQRAKLSGTSVSRYLSQLIARDLAIGAEWPPGYFKSLSEGRNELLVRSPQPAYERRLKIK